MKTKRSRKGAGPPAQKLSYSYRRFSSKNQADNTSLERQLEMAQAVSQEKGWTLIDLPPDEGVSAYKVTDIDGQQAANFHKGNLGAFLDKVKHHEIPKGSILILERLDRFSRNYFDIVFPVWLNLLQSGIEIFSCVTHTHYTLEEIRRNPMLAGMALMELANANEYSRGMGQRISKAVELRLVRCKQGAKMNLGGWNPAWVDFIGDPKQPGEFKLNEHAPTITRIVREYLDGQSMYSIARSLIKDKVPTLEGGKWSQGTIGHILQNKTLTGNAEVKGIKLPNYFPPVITIKEQKRLQAKLRENIARRGGGGASDKVANLFRNRCKCLHCGSTITTHKVGRCQHYLYVCKGKRVGQCPSQYSVKVGEVELDFFTLFLQQTPEHLFTRHSPKHNDKAIELQAEIDRYDKAIKDTTELIGTVAVAELKTKLADLERKRQGAKGMLDTLNTKMLSSQSAPKALQDIKTMVDQFLKAKGATAKDKQSLKLRDAANIVEASLKDNDTRKRLLALLPSIVKGLIIDTTRGAYSVEYHNGKRSPWRVVVAGL